MSCKILKKGSLLVPVVLFGLALAAQSSHAQEATFDWISTSEESIRLDPADYHTGQLFNPNDQAGNVHVDIEAQEPVTVEMAPAETWKEANRNPELSPRIAFRCIRQHVLKATYICKVPPARPMVLVLRDERDSVGVTESGFGFGNDLHGTVRDFVSPNDVHIQYYRWSCTEHCNPPKYDWITEATHRYQLVRSIKVYDGITAERDGEPFSVTVHSPVPVTVAMVPASMATQVRLKQETIGDALSHGGCGQQGVQSATFECTFDVANGPLALVSLPEPSSKISANDTVEIQVVASKCVANCSNLADASK
jgi:hypothetical protein